MAIKLNPKVLRVGSTHKTPEELLDKLKNSTKGVSPKVKVVSSNLKTIQYDSKKRTLHIIFKNNRVYLYQNVPIQVYEGLLKSGSKGTYFLQFIAKRYKYKEISSLYSEKDKRVKQVLENLIHG